MDPSDVRRAWETVSETYARQRDPSGSDADLVSTLRESLPADPLVLDIGCGDGRRTLANLPPGSIGLDFARSGLELATDAVPDTSLLQAEMTSIPLDDRTVDAITAYHVVFHVRRAQHPAIYEEFARVLDSGGRLLMTLPTGRFETVRQDWMGGSMLFSAPGRDETLAQLEAAGFTDLETVTATDPLGSQSEFVFATRR
jgi:SAM-dependent methyltransferase